MAVFFALFCRTKGKDKEAAEFVDDDDPALSGEDYLHEVEVRCRRVRALHTESIVYFQSPFAVRSAPTRADRLGQGQVAWARQQRLKEIEMWSVIREFAAYFIFLSLLFLLTYSTVSPSAFHQVRHLRSVLQNARQTDTDFTQVRSPASALA